MAVTFVLLLEGQRKRQAFKIYCTTTTDNISVNKERCLLPLIVHIF